MKFLFLLLSLIDVLAGFSVYFLLDLKIVYLILLAKGVWSLATSVTSKDLGLAFLGFLDFFSSLVGFFSLRDFRYIGLAVLLKGVYSLIFSF